MLIYHITMQTYSFNAYGHENVLGTNKNTIEITKEDFLTKNGDCIIGINANFDFDKLRGFIDSCKSDFIEIELKAGNHVEKIKGKLNRDFSDRNSIVLRKSNFISARTLMTEADKSSIDIQRSIISQLKSTLATLKISLISAQ